MHVLIAPDKFKGTLTAADAAEAMARGVRRVHPDATIDLCPMSDGGEGFVDAITRAAGGRFVTRRVTGPLAEMHVDATFGVIDDGRTAVIEMASAAGLALLKDADRNPLYTTTFGVGELIRFAVEMECRRVLLGIGGSATCDCGVGALQAAGCHVVLASEEYASMTEPLRADDLDEIVVIKSGRGSRVDGVEITIACDVDNPLTGPHGAAHVYGPQKGASPAEVERLDRMLASLVDRLHWQAFANVPGAGAAGGIGVGLAAMFDAKLQPGFDLVEAACGFAQRAAKADLILTGEGKLDGQTTRGKAPAGVARIAREHGKPCVAFAGVVAGDAPNFDRAIALVGPDVDEAAAIRDAAGVLERRVAEYLATR